MSDLSNLLTEDRRQIQLRDEQVSLLLKQAEQNDEQALDLDNFAALITSAEAQPSMSRRIMYSIADTVTAKNDRPTVHTYIDEYNCIPPPIFIVTISIVQVFVFVYYTYGKPEYMFTDCGGCWVDGQIGLLLFAPPLRHQIWRFESYQFLHQGLLHLLPNVIFQLLIGVPLELVHKVWRIASIYLLAVCLGALLQYTLDPSVYLVGCSAGVYALITAHLSNIIINWAVMPYRTARLAAIGGYVVIETICTLHRRFQINECDRISYTAHIAGAVTGLLMGIVILYNIEVLYWERFLMVASLTVYTTIFLFLIAMVIFVSPFSVPLWNNVRCQEATSNSMSYLEVSDFIYV